MLTLLRKANQNTVISFS